MLPVPIHEKAVAPYPPIPSAQLSLPQPHKYPGTEEGSHGTLSHADLRCDGLQEKPETCVLQYHKRILFSTVNSESEFGLNSWRVILGRGNGSLFSTVIRLASGPTKPPIQLVLVTLSSGVKKPKHKADHSPIYSADIKNGEAIHPFPLCPHGNSA
jgi:hypothetical protein